MASKCPCERVPSLWCRTMISFMLSHHEAVLPTALVHNGRLCNELSMIPITCSWPKDILQPATFIHQSLKIKKELVMNAIKDTNNRQPTLTFTAFSLNKSSKSINTTCTTAWSEYNLGNLAPRNLPYLSLQCYLLHWRWKWQCQFFGSYFMTVSSIKEAIHGASFLPPCYVVRTILTATQVGGT